MLFFPISRIYIFNGMLGDECFLVDNEHSNQRHSYFSFSTMVLNQENFCPPVEISANIFLLSQLRDATCILVGKGQ